MSGRADVTPAMVQAALANAVHHYDGLRHLASEYRARQETVAMLMRNTGLDDIGAAELLADALARRAANKQPKE